MSARWKKRPGTCAAICSQSSFGCGDGRCGCDDAECARAGGDELFLFQIDRAEIEGDVFGSSAGSVTASPIRGRSG